MGNGFPVAAVVTTPEIASKFGEGGHEYFNTVSYFLPTCINIFSIS